jgi:hypothetical protein
MELVIARIGTDCPTIPSNCFSLSIVPSYKPWRFRSASN